MDLKLWFGTWLLVCFSQANAQVHSDNFREVSHPLRKENAKENLDHKTDDERLIFSTKGEKNVFTKEDLDSDTNLYSRDPNIDPRGNEAESEKGFRKQKMENSRDKSANEETLDKLSALLRLRPASPSSEAMPKSLFPKAIGKQLRADGEEDDSSQVIGAFASLPPPAKSREKSRNGDRQGSGRGQTGFPDRFPSRPFPQRPDGRFGLVDNRLFGDNRRRPVFDNPPDIIHQFHSDSNRRGFDRQHSLPRPSENRDPVVGHSIFVNAKPEDVPRRRLPASFRGEGPIIIQHGDADLGRPVLVDLNDRPRGQLIGNSKRVIDSKFGPVLTTIHGGPGGPDIVIPQPFNVGRPPYIDSSFAFNRNFGLPNLPPRGRPLIIPPNQIPPFRRPSDIGPPSVIQVPASTIHHLNRRPPFDRPSFITTTPRPRISFFPDLGVTVDRPSLIQPEISFAASTRRPEVKVIPNRGSASVQTHGSRWRNRFHFPAGNTQINGRDWRPSLLHDTNAIPPGSFVDRRQNRQYRPFRGDEVEPTGEYSFGYSVNAPSTGDHKAVYEMRGPDGKVKGQYGLLQPDGLFRRVTYEADARSGFRANVDYIPV